MSTAENARPTALNRPAFSRLMHVLLGPVAETFLFLRFFLGLWGRRLSRKVSALFQVSMYCSAGVLVMANICMAYIIMAYIVMAYIFMAHVGLAYIVMAYIVMAYIAIWPI